MLLEFNYPSMHLYNVIDTAAYSETYRLGNIERYCWTKGHVPQQSFLGLQSWYLIIQSSHCNSFEDLALVNRSISARKT